MTEPVGDPASIVVQRRVEWTDTDATGHYHHSTVIRWVEAAEATLHERLGIAELFATIPRVRYEVDYVARLWFRDLVDISLRVANVGRASVTYKFEIRRNGEVAARGGLVAVHAPLETPGTREWPAGVRVLLESAGAQPAELLRRA
ncbi:acyl-CoA thioesterase [Allokutzneria oryzae]|uniref:Acyl-CoA thioesterase n=1 Tax=Allokutzneria oryzae TaxID=1378989 RepID=A0ABV6A7S6_9PSEU